MLRSRADLNQDEFAIAPVLVEIWPRDKENDGLSVGRDLRVGNRGDFRVVI